MTLEEAVRDAICANLNPFTSTPKMAADAIKAVRAFDASSAGKQAAWERDRRDLRDAFLNG